MCHVLYWCQLRKSVSGAGKARRWMDLRVQNRKQLEVPSGEKLIHQQWHNFTSGTERGLCPAADGQTQLTSMQMVLGMRGCQGTALKHWQFSMNRLTSQNWGAVLCGRELSRGNLHKLCCCMDFTPCELCVSLSHPSGYQSKPVLLKSRILPGWCSIHLFTLWYEGCVCSSPHQDLSLRYIWVSLFFPALWQECAPIHLFTVTCIHRILWVFFPVTLRVGQKFVVSC